MNVECWHLRSNHGASVKAFSQGAEEIQESDLKSRLPDSDCERGRILTLCAVFLTSVLLQSICITRIYLWNLQMFIPVPTITTLPSPNCDKPYARTAIFSCAVMWIGHVSIQGYEHRQVLCCCGNLKFATLFILGATELLQVITEMITFQSVQVQSCLQQCAHSRILVRCTGPTH